MDQVVLPVLGPGEREIVPLYHDESILNSNDDGNKFWNHEDVQVLHSKSRGSSIMISGVICACHGVMCAVINGVEEKSYVIIKPGKGRDGYWENRHLVAQVGDRILPIFEVLHPGMEALIIFDNSQNHHAMADDALVASKLNLYDGGKNKKPMRSTSWGPLNTPQSMHLDDEDKTIKGIKTVVYERNLWPEKAHNLSLRAKCQLCIDLPFDHITWRVEGGPICCAWHTLQSERDFQQKRTWLTETVQNRGHSVLYLPKFHCELNPIEMFWAFVKGKARAECGYTFAALENKVPECLAACPVETIRRYVRHCQRYMDGYRKGLTGPLLDFACKKYTSHRRICLNQLTYVEELETIKRDFQEYRTIKREDWGHVFNSFDLTAAVEAAAPDDLTDIFDDESDDEEEDFRNNVDEEDEFEFLEYNYNNNADDDDM